MLRTNRSSMGRWMRSALLVALAAGGLACFPQGEGDAPHAPLTAAALDAVESAVAKLAAAGRWPEWDMRVEDDHLVFEVDVAETPVASACQEIGAAVRSSVGDTVEWSAELTRHGSFLSRCGTLDVVAAAPYPRRG